MRVFSPFLALSLCACAVAATAPHVDYATYLGGSNDDQPTGVAVDATGNIYLTGTTNSPDFPLTSTAFAAPAEGQRCVFVTKINPAATAIVWSVCLPGAISGKVVAAANGDVYVLASGVVNVLAADASGLRFSAAVAGAVDMAVDAAGNVYVTGGATPGLRTTPGAYQRQYTAGNCPQDGYPMPCPNAFVTKLNPLGQVVYATYLGGSTSDYANAIAVDSWGDAWVAGETLSADFPVTENAWETAYHGGGDGFVSEFDPGGDKLLYSSYLGGSELDSGRAVAVDAAGSAYVTGLTQSADFPTTSGAWQRNFIPNSSANAGGDAFVVKLTASGAVAYATYLGGPLSVGQAIAVDAQGEAYVDYNPAIYGSPAGTPANYPSIAALSADGSSIVRSLPVEGAMALDGEGSIYLALSTYGYIFFPTAGVLQSGFGGGVYDAALIKLDYTEPASPWITTILNAAGQRTGTPQYYPVFDVAPGELIEVFGWGFDAGTRLFFDGIPAPIYFVSPGQIDAVVPFEVAGATTGVTIQGAGQTLGPGIENVFEAVPALFTLDGSGYGEAAALNQDGSVNGPSNPAARGSVVAVFMTGAGRLTPALADGVPGPLTPPFPAPVLPVGSSLGDVVFAGAAPGMIAGVVQVNIRISETAVFGNPAPLVVYIGNYASSLPSQTGIYVQ